MLGIEKRERNFLAIISIVVIVLTVAPLAFGYFITPKDGAFLFTSSIYTGDYRVYFSYIEQVKAGQFFFKNLFTSEFQPVLFFNPLWLFVGMVASVLHLSSFLAFHLVRIAFIPIFLIIAYYFLAFFFHEEFKRKLGLLLLIFASGWGFLIYEFSQYKKGIPTLDLDIAEAFSFPVLHFSPHLIASLGLMILIFLFSLQSFKFRTLKHSFLAGACALLLFSFHPYHVPTIFGVLMVFTICIFVRNKKIDLHYVKHFFILSSLSLLPLLYHLWLLSRIPMFYEHFLLPLTTPPLPVTFFSYGILIPLSLVGVFYISRKKEKSLEETFLVVWFFVQFALLYFPIENPRRLTQGWSAAIIILGIYGIFYLKDSRLAKTIVSKYFTQENNAVKLISKAGFLCLSLILLCSSNAIILTNDYFNYLNSVTNKKLHYKDEAQRNFFYLPKDTKEAMVWLKNTPEDSIILSSLSNGSFIPVFSLRKVFLGHNPETIQFFRKNMEVEKFFMESNGEERLAFLRENHIDFVFLGKEDKEKINFIPDDEKFLERAYQNSSAAIYRVMPLQE